MQYFYWMIIILMFAAAYVGLVYPIIPSVLFLAAGFFLYGVFFSFDPFNWLFWLVQGLFIALLFGADYVANIIGVKKYGGSKAGMWGSTIGLLVGPFVIPVIGILAGPFLGAILAELLFNKRDLENAVKIGFGSVVGFVSGVLTKAVIMAVMIGYFIILVK